MQTGLLHTRREFLFYSACWFPFFWNIGTVKLADIRFRVRKRGNSARRYLLIHGDESTARQVLNEHMRTAHGVAHLVTNKTRYVKFQSGKIDPNRLFSRVGAEKNLRTLNPNWSEEHLMRALDRLDRNRPKLLHALLPPQNGLLVALHNNARGYSMQDEIPISDRTALNAPNHPHEFMLCTDPADFELLARGPYNVLLQNTGPKEDDGSLSRLTARQGVRYVNIEAGIGKLQEQRDMLAFLESVLP